MFDIEEIKRAIKSLKPNNELFEIRIINKKGKNLSGYFTDADVFIEELKQIPTNILSNSHIYFTLNKIHTGCYGKEQHNKLLFGKSSTKDEEITNYEYILIDFDPKRPSGISSTDKELDKSLDLRTEVYVFLLNQGFKEPTIALSGNGCHLLYKVDFVNTEENVLAVKHFLEYLDLRFSNNEVDIDTSVYNPSRICKLYGTLAQKGSNIPERPFRMSKIETSSDEITSLDLVKKVANMLPKIDSQIQNDNYAKFKLEDFLYKHNIRVKDTIQDKNGTKYILEECPFNREHNKDKPAIFQLNNGAIGFKCFHNSCSNNGWKEFRNYYEPDYESKHSVNPYVKQNQVNNTELDSNIKYLYGFDEIENYSETNKDRVLTNIRELDKMLGGFTYDCVSLWASQTNGGKTTLLTMLTREFIKQGKKIFYFNGEQTKENFKNNLLLQNTNREHIKSIEYKNTGIYDDFVDNEALNKSNNFYNGYIFVYNNEAPRNIDTLIKVMIKARKELDIRDFIIDNLMQIDISGNDTLREQERLTEKLRTFAINTKSNVHLIAHSRKTTGSYMRLNLFDIAGSQNIANKSYNIITITRTDQLDKTSNEYERLKNDCINNGYDIEELDSVLEVLKYKYRRGRTGLVGLQYMPENGEYKEVIKRTKTEIELQQIEKEKQRLNKPKKRRETKEYY